MPHLLATVSLSAFALGLISFFWRLNSRSRGSISHLPGPPSNSWLAGNIPSFQRAEDAAQADFEWTKEYGTSFRLKGCFGEDVLYVSDPKALQYILNRGYNFPKAWESRIRLQLLAGRGIGSVEGSQHARHRRIMNSSFSQSALKEYLPLFFDIARKTVTAWKRTIRKQGEDAPVIDVSALLSRTALDAIGEAAFGYEFNSIEGEAPRTDLEKAYQNLFVDANYMASDFSIAFKRVLGYAPLWLLGVLTSLPKKDLRRVAKYKSVARNVAKGMMEKQMHAHQVGNVSGKNVMSIFVKANTAEDPKRRLEEDEILSQITTLMFAGHESTANTLSWIFYELSRHPEAQRKVRKEVKALREDVASREDSGITMPDLESMKYTTAVIKETLRYHPIVIQLSRRAGHDDIIPLDINQQTAAGDTIKAIPVRKGQVVQLGLASYNRLKAVWGGDADEWNPERFLEEKPKEHKTNLGVYGNLASFSSGLRACIGWRFSLIEMQAVLVELIENFEFRPAPNIEIKRVNIGFMQSMVKEQEGKGSQMPLTVSAVSQAAA